MVVNVIAESQDEKGKKVNLYNIGIRKLFYSIVSGISYPTVGAEKLIYYLRNLKRIKIHIANGYYPNKRQFIDEYDVVIGKPGKYHLKQGEVRITGGGEKVDCDYYYHLHTLNFTDMEFEVVE